MKQTLVTTKGGFLFALVSLNSPLHWNIMVLILKYDLLILSGQHLTYEIQERNVFLLHVLISQRISSERISIARELGNQLGSLCAGVGVFQRN